MQPRRRTSLRLGVAALAVIALGVADLGPATAQASPARPSAGRAAPLTAPLAAPLTSARQVADQVQAPVPELHWSRCYSGSRLQCTTARVPLDYDRPNGPTIRLNLSRLRATPAPGHQPTGTLFVNPGGPGGPSSGVTDIFGRLLGSSVRRHFDIVGIDPRGIGGSTPVRCRIPEPAPPYLGRAFPMTAAEINRTIAFNRYFRTSCRKGGNPILDHMTTADTARDMDLIRQAVGDDKLTYYGISYGTFLGATYARLFPGRVRALITDGVLDPVAWSTGRHGSGARLPFSTRLRSGHGAAEALLSAFEVCDRVGRARCRFAGDATGKWRSMMNRLRTAPVRLSDGSRLHYADVVAGVLGALYSRQSYGPVMRDLQRIWTHLPNPAVAARQAYTADGVLVRVKDRLAGHVRDLPYGYGPRFSPGFEGVACADTVNPTNPRAWVRAAADSERGQPWFGRLWTWASAACPRWPGSHADAYRGPWRIRTGYPVLIVGNSHDPATPISGARALHRSFGNSRLFQLNGWGHGAIGQSRCVTRTFSAYLVHRKLPSGGTVCQPDKGLFPVRR